MSSKPETRFYTGIHNAMPKGDPYRMKNNNLYLGGVPDCWYSGSHGDLWIEYKWLARIPVRASIDVDLSELQKKWLKERAAEGRNVAVIVGCPEGGVLLRNGAWEEAISPADFRAALKTKKELAAWLVSETCGGNDASTHRPRHGCGTRAL